MYTPAADEKSVTVMIYTASGLIRGNLVTKQNVRINIWLRTDNAPKYMHLVDVTTLLLGLGQVKTLQHPEMFLPVDIVQAYHLVPPHVEQLDYDENEVNRVMTPATGILGTFLFKGESRISSQTDFGVTIEVARASWMSFYNVSISNPYLPQLNLQVPMMIFRPEYVSFTV